MAAFKGVLLDLGGVVLLADMPLPGSVEAVARLRDDGLAVRQEALNAAYHELERGAEFIALANNRNFRAADGELNLDAGAFVAALAFASRRKPIVLGKPSARFFAGAIASIACSLSEAIMVGDDVGSDVGGTLAAGLSGVLVKTGKYRDCDESRIDPPPTHVSSDLAEAADWIIAQ